MIRIVKPDEPPTILKTKGAAATRSLKAAYQNGQRTFDFDGGIYAHKQVKAALKTAQHDKCFLCESKVSHIAYGDVEHFRPKGGYRQSEADELEQPGYYWLAYTWANLFFSCQLCNQQFKRNLFPLNHSEHRAKSHQDALAHEEPIFINPAIEDPEEFISFRQELPVAVEENPRGQAVIEQLGLKRIELHNKRRERYEFLRYFFEVANDPDISQLLRAQAQAFLQKAAQDSAEYAAMTRAALAAGFTLKL